MEKLARSKSQTSMAVPKRQFLMAAARRLCLPKSTIRGVATCASLVSTTHLENSPKSDDTFVVQKILWNLKQGTMTVRSQVNQKSYPWLSSVCCECHSRYVDDTWTGCHYFLLISWFINLFMTTCFISEQELLVAVLRSVSKIQLLLCYQTK
uniref:Pentatricopeptide repeat-containing protein n=1 Tax=Solanum tuberosum TaxID=4113 RepID=M1AKS0_SOLTU